MLNHAVVTDIVKLFLNRPTSTNGAMPDFELFGKLKEAGHKEPDFEAALFFLTDEKLVCVDTRKSDVEPDFSRFSPITVGNSDSIVERGEAEGVFLTSTPKPQLPELWVRIIWPTPKLAEWWKQKQAGPEDHYAGLEAAVVRLIEFVTKNAGGGSHGQYVELLKLDQEIESLCQVTGLTLAPPSFFGHYGDDCTGYCKTPVMRHTGGISIWRPDAGWLVAMNGLKQKAKLAGDVKRQSVNAKEASTAEKSPQPTSQNSRPANTAEKLVDRLFAGPDDVLLTAADRALVKAWLKTTPLSMSEQYAAKEEKRPYPLQEKKRKVQRILIYNQELDATPTDMLSPAIEPLEFGTEDNGIKLDRSQGIDTTPIEYVRPLEREIQAAKKDIPSIVFNSPNAGDCVYPIPPPPHRAINALKLAGELQKRNHAPTAAHWAIHLMQKEGLLQAVIPEFGRLGLFQDGTFQGAGTAPAKQFAGPVPFDQWLAQSTEALRELMLRDGSTRNGERLSANANDSASTLIERANELVAFADRHDNEMIAANEFHKAEELDAKIWSICQQLHIPGPTRRTDPQGVNNFLEFTQLPYQLEAEGGIEWIGDGAKDPPPKPERTEPLGRWVFPDEEWQTAMRSLRNRAIARMKAGPPENTAKAPQIERERVADEATAIDPNSPKKERGNEGDKGASPTVGSSEWLTVTEAAKIAFCSKGTITRAVNNGDLKSNGKNDRERRIDAVDLTRWMLNRADKPEQQESYEAVARKLRNPAAG